MNNKLRLSVGTMAVMTVLAGPVSANGDDYDRWFGRSIDGAWETVVTVREDGPDCKNSNPIEDGINPFPGLTTFHMGGTLSETGSRSPPSNRSAGHGVWERVGRDTFSARIRFQSFDANGLLFANMTQTTRYTLSLDGKSFNAVSRFQFAIENGPTLKFCATLTGDRITL